MIDPGKLDRRITLQEGVVTGRDSHGGKVIAWQDVATVWAAKRDLRGRELFAAQQVKGEITSSWIIRWREGITPDMRFICEGVIYEITGPPIELAPRRSYLQLDAQVLS